MRRREIEMRDVNGEEVDRAVHGGRRYLKAMKVST
jgi:hypothetical protein